MNVQTYSASNWWDRNRAWGGLSAGTPGSGDPGSTTSMISLSMDASGNCWDTDPTTLQTVQVQCPPQPCSGIWQYLPSWAGGCTPTPISSVTGATNLPGPQAQAAQPTSTFQQIMGDIFMPGQTSSGQLLLNVPTPSGLVAVPIPSWIVGSKVGTLPVPDPHSSATVANIVANTGQTPPANSIETTDTKGNSYFIVPTSPQQAHDQTLQDLHNWAVQMNAQAPAGNCSSASAQLFQPGCTWGDDTQGGIDCKSFGNMLINPTKCNTWGVIGLTALGGFLLLAIVAKKA